MKQLITILILSILATQTVYAGRFIASTGIPIENQFIVVLKDELPSFHARESLLQNLASHHDGKLTHTYQSALNGGVMRISEAKAKALANNPLVDFVEHDSMIQLIVPLSVNSQSPTSSWGLDRIDQRDLTLNNTFNYSNDGSGVTAYIIDTGILTTHEEFSVNRASIGYDAVSDGQNGVDCNGHGTHVAGTVGGVNYGVAKNVNLVAVRVLDCKGSGTVSGVISGIDWVTKNRNSPSVANMSLGGGASTSLDTAVSNSIKSGIAYVVAAGNSGQNACNYSPARVAAAVTVGATDVTDTRPSWSNYGRCLDLFSPGASITSSWIGSNSAINTISGTSMAAPHVTGVVALILQTTSSVTPKDVAIILINNSTGNVVKAPGANSPNRLLFTDY